MQNRPWDDSETVAGQIRRSRVLHDPVQNAAGTGDVTVEFEVPAARPWERDARIIRSSIALGSDGVYEMSIRMAEATLQGLAIQARKTLEDALESAVASSSMPATAQYRVRGGREGWNPHAMWSGRPGTRHYNRDDGESERIQPRRATRMADNVVTAYRKKVESA